MKISQIDISPLIINTLNKNGLKYWDWQMGLKNKEYVPAIYDLRETLQRQWYRLDKSKGIKTRTCKR